MHACIFVKGAKIKKMPCEILMTYENYRYIGHILPSCVALFLSPSEWRQFLWESERERKWEIIFPVQTNGLWLRKAGLKLEWCGKQCTFAFKSIWPAKAPFLISKTRQLQPITSIYFPFSFSFLSCSCMQKKENVWMILSFVTITDDPLKRNHYLWLWNGFIYLFSSLPASSEGVSERSMRQRGLTEECVSACGSWRQSLEQFLKLLTSVWRLAQGLRARSVWSM